MRAALSFFTVAACYALALRAFGASWRASAERQASGVNLAWALFLLALLGLPVLVG